MSSAPLPIKRQEDICLGVLFKPAPFPNKNKLLEDYCKPALNNALELLFNTTEIYINVHEGKIKNFFSS